MAGRYERPEDVKKEEERIAALERAEEKIRKENEEQQEPNTTAE
jgi:hypothetical protein